MSPADGPSFPPQPSPFRREAAANARVRCNMNNFCAPEDCSLCNPVVATSFMLWYLTQRHAWLNQAAPIMKIQRFQRSREGRYV